MSPAPAKPRLPRPLHPAVWWLALATGVTIISATAFLWGSQTAAQPSATMRQQGYTPTPRPNTETHQPARVSVAALPAAKPVDREPEALAEPVVITRVVYVDRPVIVEKETVTEVVVEKEVIVEREKLVPVPAPNQRVTLAQDNAPPALPTWMKPGALVFWYQPDGTHRSGRISTMNSDYVVVLWSGGKAEHTADFASKNFESKARPRTTPSKLPAAVAEEEVKRRNTTAGDAAQQEKLNSAWSNRRR